jgi:aryl sulfotransferase
MPKLVRAPVREVRNRLYDSERWAGYQARSDDVIIGTYQKCGTTWMQRIVGMLVFRSPAPFSVFEASPWPDIRYFPADAALAQAEAQTHRRFLKTHLPYDAMPVYEGVKFIHVARDGRDAATSWHNHATGYMPEFIEAMSAINLADPKFGDRYPIVDADPARHFHDWVMGPGDEIGDPHCSFFHVENSYWAARNDPNMLLVHYADLKQDRAGEMRRIADFLNIGIPESLWPELVEAAGFDAMKSHGEEIFPAGDVFEGGANRFFHKGTNGRWQNVVSAKDLELYDAKVKKHFAPDLARWIEHGWRGAS